MRPAAHPQIELTTTMVVPFSAMAFSTSSAVRASAIPAAVSSWRIGATIISGYIGNSSWLDLQRQFYHANQKQRLHHGVTETQRKSFCFFPACDNDNPVILQENIPLAPMTTLKVGGPARYFVLALTEAEVREAVAFADSYGLPLLVMGAGSNLLISDSGWPGLALKVAIRGTIKDVRTRTTNFSVGAGEPWDSVVAHAVQENCGGIECLSGIPGTVGGTPVQNVGAYGQEVAETIAYVRVLELSSGQTRDLTNSECGFSYRNSVFNGSHRGRYVVLKVAYQLFNSGRPRIEYTDLKKRFAGAAPTPTLHQVRDAVIEIRRSKAMVIDDNNPDCLSAGSFFKNPVVTPVEALRVQTLAEQRVPGSEMPRYRAEHHAVKLSAAWLVEQSGFHKGYALGNAGISGKHSLAIINRNPGATTAQDI